MTADALLAKSVDWVRSSYARYDGQANPAFTLPVTQHELREQVEELLRGDRTLTSTAASVALLAHYDLASYGERAHALVDDARGRDIRFAVASADTAKRVRVVDRRPDGVVVSGGKQHVVGAAVVHELLVVPSGPVTTPEEAVALHGPGQRPGDEDRRQHDSAPRRRRPALPFSRHNSISEALVIINDVFIPYERVVLDGEVELGATLSTALNEVDLAAGAVYLGTASGHAQYSVGSGRLKLRSVIEAVLNT